MTLPDMPQWLTDAIARMHFPGNVREVRNLAERIGVRPSSLSGWLVGRYCGPPDLITRIEKALGLADGTLSNLTAVAAALASLV